MNNITCVFGTKFPSSASSTAKTGVLDPGGNNLGNPPSSKSKETKEGKDIEMSLEATEVSGVQNRYTF